MKSFKMLTVILLMTNVVTSAFAEGEKGGNGGIAYICRDTSGQITTARILDLWEPESFKPFQTNGISESIQLENAVAKVRSAHPENMDVLEAFILQGQASAFHVSKPLPLSNDALPDYEPEKGCKFEQVALYGWVNETGKYQLRIYDGIFMSPHFSNSDRAALWMHEGLYQIDDKYHEAKDSRRTRSINAEVFSSKDRLSDLIAQKLEMLMKIQPYSSGAITLDDKYGLVISINGAAGFYSDRTGYPQCTIIFEQNGKSVSLDGIVDNHFTISKIFNGGADILGLVPGLLNFSLECDNQFLLELRICQNNAGVADDVTDQVIGNGARRIYSQGGTYRYSYSAFLKP